MRRNELANELKYKSPVVVRNELVYSAMKVGEAEPPHIPTTGCLKQIKYERECSEHYHSNPVLALWTMTKIPPYDDVIRHIYLYILFMFTTGCRVKMRIIKNIPVKIE